MAPSGVVLSWAAYLALGFASASLVLPRSSDFELGRLSSKYQTQQVPLSTTDYEPRQRFQPGNFTKYQQDEKVCKTYGERQWTGTVDVTEERRLFYWFFESRHDPENDPVVIWLNGGPGGSSMMGLFTEMGPCTVTNDSKSTTPNPFSWNNNASVIFIDQPAGTGLSSIAPGAPYPKSDQEAAVDLAFFINTFFNDIFPDKAALPVHIAGESYGGHYVPTSVNHLLEDRARNSRDAYAGNISSIILVNALIDIAAPSIGAWELLCSEYRGNVFNESVCEQIAIAMPECEQLARDCRRTGDGNTCLGALLYCMTEIDAFYQAEQAAGRKSPYNIHLPCTNHPFCWDETIGNYSNYVSQPRVLEALHFPPDFHFQAVNLDLNIGFALSKSEFLSQTPYVTRILESGIRVLVLNGNEDYIVNTPGQIWAFDSLPWSGQAGYRAAQWKPWADDKGFWKLSKNQQLAFVGVDGAGHAAPGDQKQTINEIVNTWIQGWHV